MSLLRTTWAEEATQRLARKVLATIDFDELLMVARKVDAATDAEDSPRLRALTQFVATAAVLRNEAEGVIRHA